MTEEINKNYIVWTYIPYEGWNPMGYETLEEAVRANMNNKEDFIITKGKINYDTEISYHFSYLLK